MYIFYLRIFQSWKAIWQYVAKSLKSKCVQFDPKVAIYPKETITQVDKDR